MPYAACYKGFREQLGEEKPPLWPNSSRLIVSLVSLTFERLQKGDIDLILGEVRLRPVNIWSGSIMMAEASACWPRASA